MNVLEPLVSVVISTGADHTPTRIEGVMIGLPSRAGGKPIAVEVLLPGGRYTLVPFRQVEAVNDVAKDRLNFILPKAEAHG